WGGSVTPPIPVAKDEESRFNQPWRVSAWCRGGGAITINAGKKDVAAKAGAGGNWELITVTLPPEQIAGPAANVVVTLHGPGEFDDVAIQEKLPDAPNLVPNPGFEQVDAKGYPLGWSAQKKYRAIGPTYYVWTDWNHYFRENRGGVTTDELVMH